MASSPGYLIPVSVHNVVPLGGAVVDKELDGGHHLDLERRCPASCHTWLRSVMSWLLLGPGTGVTTEGAAGSCRC